MELNQILNFGAGPSKLPKQVLEEIEREMSSYANTGMSILELSHRSHEYQHINEKVRSTLGELLKIPANYTTLLVAGGGQGQFAAIPLNLIGRTGTADYLVTGIWSKVAAEEAKNHGDINIAAESEVKGTIPDPKTWQLNPKASYVFYCDNDTIEGVEFPYIPETNGVPLVADMSSSILTKQINVSKFGVIFAASQKNLGTAGIAVVIIRKDLLGNAKEHCPNILNYTILSKHDSILNTPPIFPVYVLGKILQWVKKQGGVSKMECLCKLKAKLICDYIDKSGFYYLFAEKPVRSRINFTFRLGRKEGDEILEEKFIEKAANQQIYQVKGHRLIGGIRISLYNSITEEEVAQLIKFMSEFEKEYKQEI